MGWFALLLAIIFVILCILIVLIILIQPGQSEGLAGTFGSGGMLGSAFGVHMKNRLTKFTTIMVILFFTIIFIFALSFKSGKDESPFDEAIDKKPTEEEKAPEGSKTETPKGSLSPVVEEVVPIPAEDTKEKTPETPKKESPEKKPE